jgi:TnpA family transposase
MRTRRSCLSAARRRAPAPADRPPAQQGRALARAAPLSVYANEGHIRHRTPEQQAEQALCLTIVCNAIIVWNTVYTQQVLDHLRAEGQLITSA